ncbi:hypothetical protein RBH94_05325 [Aestuariibaculum sp. YM273]|uniref:hypothetical protein n=1 Tax=Aestuariibaculum sp. YM273 TaxID=3070659 RepID=UPI0027DC6C1C|nr:hypothetical protein [Aestuariibaculum sp. YM273]WMI66582.1 hypothetical protein RBH94_05325 [Aestuariibaculum sp. YM273]
MKKLLLFSLSLLLFVSCNTDDDYDNYYFEILPVKSVDIPEEFVMGETYPITVSYEKPSSCYVYRNLYYAKDNNQRTVAPIMTVYDNNNCQPLVEFEEDVTFNFIVTSNGSYVFKFWQGEDENGEDLYLTIEVPVVE